MRLVSLLASALLTAGCADDVAGLLLTIDVAGLAAGADIDEVHVDMVASLDHATGASASTCRAVSETVPGPRVSTLSFPFDIAIRPGDRSWECVAVRVTARKDGSDVLRNEGLYCVGLESFAHQTILLERDCHESYRDQACAATQVCREGSCEGSRVGALFEGAAEVDVACALEY